MRVSERFVRPKKPYRLFWNEGHLSDNRMQEQLEQWIPHGQMIQGQMAHFPTSWHYSHPLEFRQPGN